VDNDVPPQPCYTGPEGTEGMGPCKGGTRACTNGNFEDGPCTGQVLPANEACNGLDDDCDGQVDEDFVFGVDPSHCGGCNQACLPGQLCAGGSCLAAAETDCGNGVDDDHNGLTDCDDPQCEGRACGFGCVCGVEVKVETLCANGVDDDGDGFTDCEDPDCLGQACQAAPATFV
jgi:hypothetical protein